MGRREYALWRSSATLAVRFYYQEETLRFVYPLANGCRGTALAYFPQELDGPARGPKLVFHSLFCAHTDYGPQLLKGLPSAFGQKRGRDVAKFEILGRLWAFLGQGGPDACGLL